MPDVCGEIPSPVTKCRQCIPNPYSIVSNWRNRNQLQPILNEKSCKYQITFVTPATTTGFVEGMTEEEAEEAKKSAAASRPSSTLAARAVERYGDVYNAVWRKFDAACPAALRKSFRYAILDEGFDARLFSAPSATRWLTTSLWLT